jgi:hypothetical protein
MYYSIIAVPFLFALWVLYLKTQDMIPADPGDPGTTPLMFKYILYGLAPGLIIASALIYRHLLTAIDERESLRKKLNQLQTAMLVRAGFLELPALLACVAATVTGDIAILVFTGLMVAAMIFFRPTAESISLDLKLSDQERMALTNPNVTVD